MINQSLYTKYRPKTFSDVCGQEYISRILKNQVSTNKFTHAYLFEGTRGTGKTTCARIFAKAINCTNNKDGNPCYECEMCIKKEVDLNVIELDAASNNSVDQIRKLIEEIKYINFVGKYKVYILDEVHMLSISAFNALLKTLEEPPLNVIFILSTTEFKKIPKTVVSRCQRFQFKNISKQDIYGRLYYICDMEKIHISKEAIDLIASFGNGSMRDSISILQQIILYTETTIDEEIVRNVLGVPSNKIVLKFLQNIVSKDVLLCLNNVRELLIENISLNSFLGDFKNVLRDLMFLKLNESDYEFLFEKNRENIDVIKNIATNISFNDIVFLMDRVNKINLKNSIEIELRIELELFIINICKSLKVDLHQSRESLIVEESKNQVIFKKIDKSEVVEKSNLSKSNWCDFLSYLKKESCMVLYSLLKNGELYSVEEDSVCFKCNSVGIDTRLKELNTIKQIEEKLKNFYGKDLFFKSILEKGMEDSKIEDKVKEYFGDDIEIEFK